MSFCRLSAALAFTVAAALGLAGCGRSGPLDPPPSSAAPPPPAAAAPTNFIDPLNPIGEPQQTSGRSTLANPPPQALSKSFILDPLLR